MFSRKGFFVLLIFVTIITRFIKIDWGSGYFFHPDEDNMAVSVTRLNTSSLNPKFFAYGQFPLYLGYFSLNLLHIPNTFGNSVHILRLWSAFFSVISVALIYLITRELFNNRQVSTISVILTIFHPGLIQLAHFGTTESLLIFLFLCNLYLAIQYIKKRQFSILLLASISSGIAIGTKISSAVFLVPLLLGWLYVAIKSRHLVRSVFSGVLFVFCSIIFIAISSPFNIVDYEDFASSMSYETSVATGAIKVFYTSQFLHTTPYLFALSKIFPYVNGIPLYIFSIFGTTALLFKKNKNINLWVVMVSVLIYFVYYGQLYIKWTRFMSPIFFLFPVFASYFISTSAKKTTKSLLILLSILPGIIFLTQYTQPDIRLQASDWILKNIPENSSILSEGGNVVDIPVGGNNLNTRNFDFYTLDHNQNNIKNLANLISNSDYIINPSRRVYANQKFPEFPQSQCYFQNLFSGNLGFALIKEFHPNNEYINGVYAEESWTVFDRPTVRIYKKIRNLSESEYLDLILCQK